MKTFEQFITETFTKTFDWEWTVITTGMVQAKFTLDNGTVYTVKFDEEDDEGTWFAVFEANGSVTKTTNDFKSLQILATVMEIMKAFFEKFGNGVGALHFDGAKSDINRASTYEKLLKRFLPTGWSYDIYDKGKKVDFVIQRKE